MKRNELKMLIRQTAEREMPEVLDKIPLNDIEVVPETVRKPRLTFRFTNVLGFAALILVLGFTSIFIYQFLNPLVPPQTVALDSEVEVYGFQMVSAASLLDSVEPLGLSLVPLSMDTEAPLISDEIENLTTYLNLMETMLGSVDAISFTPVASDRAEFQTMVVYDSVDLMGNAITHRIYYNEIPDPADNDKTYVEGLMVLSGRELQLNGTITENEDGTKTRFIAKIDENNYVSVEDQSTDEVQKFRYQVVQAGVLVQENEIRLVLEEENITAVIDYETETAHVQYRFRKTLGDATGSTIRVQYSCLGENDDLEDGEIEVTVEYDEVSATYRYQYQVSTEHGNHAGNHQYTGNRTVTSDDDDDEEDEENGNSQGNAGDDEENGNDNTTTTQPGNQDDEPGNEDHESGNDTTTTQSGNDDDGKGTGSPNHRQPASSGLETDPEISSIPSPLLSL
jgi:hypothetical protein